MKAFLAGFALLAGLVAAGWMGWLAAWLPASLQQAGTTGSSPAPVYVWTDAQGRRHYGDAPPAGGKAEAVQLPELTVVTLPKTAPQKPALAVPQQPPFDADGNPVVTPSRQLRNPALESMGLAN